MASEERTELPAEVWLLTNGKMAGFHRLGLQMPQWNGRIVDLLPRLTTAEGWQRARFLWSHHGRWRQPTSCEQVAAFASTLVGDGAAGTAVEERTTTRVQKAEETQRCPECGMKMLLMATGAVFTSDPPLIEQQWRCGCGYRGEKRMHRCSAENELFMRAWRNENGVSEPKEASEDA